MNMKLTIRSKISDTCVGASVTLRRVTKPRTNIVKDEKGDLIADSHSILAMWKYHFSAVECRWGS
jgi:hypothetical protein